jgi:hypothetical protein
MTLAARPRPGVPGVARGLVDELEPLRRQRRAQPSADGVDHGHRKAPFSRRAPQAFAALACGYA